MIFVHDDDLAGAASGVEDGVLVEGGDGAEIEDVAVDAFTGKRVGGLQAFVQHQAVADEGEVVAGAAQRRLADGDGREVRGDLATDEAVGAFVLQEDHRVWIGDRGGEQGAGVGRGWRAGRP